MMEIFRVELWNSRCDFVSSSVRLPTESTDSWKMQSCEIADISYIAFRTKIAGELLKE